MTDTHRSSPGRASAPVTAVVINCNGGHAAPRCLNSVAASDPPPELLVLVDNGSTDGTRSLIDAQYRGAVPLDTVWLPTNVGLAAARNIGSLRATTRLIAFLDNDTVVFSTWLKFALETMAAFEADCVQCRLVIGADPARLDSLGYLLGPFGFPRHLVRPGAMDSPKYDRPRLLFGVKAAAMLIAKQALERVGGFDPAFFIYGEETDLCWRLLRSGSRVVLAPESRVLHFSGGTRRFLPTQADELLYRGGTRNYIRMVAKNAPAPGVLADLVGQLVIWLGLAAVQAARGKFTCARLIALGVIDGLASLPEVMRARHSSPLPYVQAPRELRMQFSLAYLWRIVRAV